MEVATVGATLLVAVLGMGTFTHQAVSGVRDDVTLLRGDLSDVRIEVSEVRGELQRKIADIRGEVSDLRSEMADFRERVTRALGDLGARLARLEGALGIPPQPRDAASSPSPASSVIPAAVKACGSEAPGNPGPALASPSPGGSSLAAMSSSIRSEIRCATRRSCSSVQSAA